MRTPDDGLIALAQANGLDEDLTVTQLEQVRDVLDELGRGLQTGPADVFWSRLAAARDQILGHAAPAQPVEVAPPAPAVPPPTRVSERPRGGSWKPHDPKVRHPYPDQEETAILETGEAGTLRIPAADMTRDWPLKRVARLHAAYTSHQKRGEITLEDICQFFRLPDEGAVKAALRAWQRRFAADEALAARHAELLRKNLREGDDGP